MIGERSVARKFCEALRNSRRILGVVDAVVQPDDARVHCFGAGECCFQRGDGFSAVRRERFGLDGGSRVARVCGGFDFRRAQLWRPIAVGNE